MPVAQVSAAAAARLHTAIQIASSDAPTSAPVSAATAAGPPLASTCEAERATAPVASSLETAVALTKNVTRAAAPGHPAPPRIAAPTPAAATAPLRVRAPVTSPFGRGGRLREDRGDPEAKHLGTVDSTGAVLEQFHKIALEASVGEAGNALLEVRLQSGR